MAGHLHNAKGELAFSEQKTLDVLRVIGAIEAEIKPIYVRLDGDTCFKVIDWLEAFSVDQVIAGVVQALRYRVERDEYGVPDTDSVTWAISCAPAHIMALMVREEIAA